jgi:hypothetical protein
VVIDNGGGSAQHCTRRNFGKIGLEVAGRLVDNAFYVKLTLPYLCIFNPL